MLPTKYCKVVLLVALHWALKVHSAEGQNYGLAFQPNYREPLSESEVDRVLNNWSERQRLRLSIDQLASKRLPEKHQCQNVEQIYDTTARVCATPKTQAHCGYNMLFLPVVDTDDLGACTCGDTYSLPCWGRPQHLHENDKCYAVATRGPCYEGQTLNPTDKFHAECSPDACILNAPENAYHFSEGSKHHSAYYPVFNFTLEGKCYTTESQAFCQRGQVVRFILPYKTPVCVYPNELKCSRQEEGGYAQAPKALICGEGYVANPTTGMCMPVQVQKPVEEYRPVQVQKLVEKYMPVQVQKPVEQYNGNNFDMLASNGFKAQLPIQFSR